MTEKMTAEQATTFDGKSQTHEQYLAMVAAQRGCQCKAYTDFFTYRRWKAQGFQVQKGEKGTALQTYIPITKTDPATGEKNVVGRRPRTTHVFCKCQVKKI